MTKGGGTAGVDSKKNHRHCLFLLLIGKSAYFMDVGGGTTTQSCGEALYDKFFPNLKMKLSKGNTIKLENVDADVPLSTVLYRLLTLFPKVSPVKA